MLQAFDIASVAAPGQPNRTTGARPYKDVGGILLPTLSDGTLVLAQIVVEMPYQYGVVTANTATTILNGTQAARYLVGLKNLSTAAQSVTITLYDNASAASGTVVDVEPALAAGQIVTFPNPGIPLANGLTALASGTPGGSGIMIMVR